MLILTFAVALAAVLLQEVPVPVVDAVDTLLRVVALALLVIPVAEVRKLFGGLPSIPLPGGNEIKAGRWFSWVAAALVLLFGHFVGWLAAPDFANFQAWAALELAILAGTANIIYEKLWRGQIGLDEPPPA